METFDYYTIDQKGNEDYVVYGWGKYGEGSVLAGQARKCYIESYKTLEAAQAACASGYLSNQWMEPQVNVNHLPGEDDPVPGGMYPDDYDDGI